MKRPNHKLLVPLALTSTVLAIIGISYALEVFVPDNAAVGYVGMPAVTDNDVTSDNEIMYSIDYSTLDWSGNVHAYALGADGVIHSETDLWTGGAAAKIDAQNWDTGRKIITLNGSTKVPFRWADLSTTQQDDLGGDEKILKYLRGDRSNEDPNGLKLRKRNTVLGDIIHATPIYWEDPSTYSNGVETKSTNCSSLPCKTLFVGANDGMLHVLDASTGQERFAFIPSQLIPKLSSLSNTDYTHTYFVDGQLAIKTYDTQTVLVGTLGGGGMGMYALDVSNPNPADENAAKNKILWEISSATTGFSSLGNVYGKPVMTKAQDGTAMVLVGNGYNNTSGNGYAVLYKINALNGSKIGEISTATGTSSTPNGLSTPTLVDTDLDGRADIAFAGDIDGNLWKFNLKNDTKTKLFTTGSNQAITMAPAVAPHPNGGYMVVFVTGKLFTADDQKDASTHYAYGVWDSAPVANTAMATQTITETTYTSGTTSIKVRKATDTAIDWGVAKGWKTALPGDGERVVGGDDALISSEGAFRFLSSNPTVNPTALVPGDNWWMELNPLTGGATGINRFDLNGDTVIDVADKLSDGSFAVGRSMGGGIRSQLITLFANGYSVFHANYDRNGAPPSPATKGVAGGHFDVEFYKAPTDVCEGESAGAAAKKAVGYVNFTFSDSKNPTYITIKVGAETVIQTAIPSGDNNPDELDDFLDGKGSANYALVGNYNRNDSRLGIVAKSSGAAYNGAVTVTFTPANTTYTKQNVTGGTDATLTQTDSSTRCERTEHTHEYDDIYDKTGVNMLNPSDPDFKLSRAISSDSQQFKVLVHNQYLNPAAMLHIDTAGYDPASAAGYVFLKDYQTASTLDVASLPAFTRTTIKSLAINLPVDAFDVRDWWGSDDKRNGLLSSSPQCVYYGTMDSGGDLTNSSLADMYTPVVPPANGDQGGGTLATTGTASTGARHNGALTVQIIKADTPQSAVEQNVSGRPEYGYRVKQSHFYAYVLAEYTMFWHHPRRVCYHDKTTDWYDGDSGGNGYPSASRGPWNTAAKMVGKGWTKDAPEDTSEAGASSTPENGSTDPKLGTFGSIQGGIGGGTGSGTGGTGGTGTSGDLHNIVTGGEVIANAPGSGGTAGGGSGTGVPGLKDVFGLKGRVGRVNWREVFR